MNRPDRHPQAQTKDRRADAPGLEDPPVAFCLRAGAFSAERSAGRPLQCALSDATTRTPTPDRADRRVCRKSPRPGPPVVPFSPAADMAVPDGMADDAALVARVRFAPNGTPMAEPPRFAVAGRPGRARPCWGRAGVAAVVDRDSQQALDAAERGRRGTTRPRHRSPTRRWAQRRTRRSCPRPRPAIVCFRWGARRGRGRGVATAAVFAAAAQRWRLMATTAWSARRSSRAQILATNTAISNRHPGHPAMLHALTSGRRRPHYIPPPR